MASADMGGTGTGIGQETVALVLDFQRTGQGFTGIWNQIFPHVDGLVRSRLRKRLVRGAFGRDNEDAVAETLQQVALDLLTLPEKPQSWFDEGRGTGGPDQLRAWLFGFCNKNVAKYCQKWHGDRKSPKVLAESSLPLNDQRQITSIVKSAVAKIQVDDVELRQILNECIEGLPDGLLREVIRLHGPQELSEREIAKRLKMNVTTLHRRIKRAEKLLGEALKRRGVDISWLESAA